MAVTLRVGPALTVDGETPRLSRLLEHFLAMMGSMPVVAQSEHRRHRWPRILEPRRADRVVDHPPHVRLRAGAGSLTVIDHLAQTGTPLPPVPPWAVRAQRQGPFPPASKAPALPAEHGPRPYDRSRRARTGQSKPISASGAENRPTGRP